MISLVGAAGVVIGVAFLFAEYLARTLSQERVLHHSKRGRVEKTTDTLT